MSTELSSELLATITAQTFEEAAFVFTEPTEEPWPAEVQVVEASISLGGAQNALVIAGSTTFAMTLAANLLGIEIDEAESSGPDALSEMVNILGGVLAEKLESPGNPCLLGIPEVETVSVKAHEEKVQGAACSVALLADDEDRLDVTVYTENSG